MDKIFEKIILKKLDSQSKSHNVIPSFQFGFQANFATTHQLNRLANTITSNRNIKKSTGLVTLDLEKAFDTVWHDGLIFKLISNNFPPKLIILIKSFLSNRSGSVHLHSYHSVLFIHSLNPLNLLPACPKAVCCPQYFLIYLQAIYLK